MLFGNAVQPVDAGIPALQTFLQMGARPNVLVPRPMKFDACLGQPFLDVQSLSGDGHSATRIGGGV